MKHFAAVIIALLFLIALASPQATAQGKKTTITGTVVDTYCLVTMNMGGASHKKCAAQCVRNGSPLSIKEEKTGTVYLAAGQKNMVYASPLLEKYVEERVVARGTVYERDGVKMIVLDSVTPAR